MNCIKTPVIAADNHRLWVSSPARVTIFLPSSPRHHFIHNDTKRIS